MTGHEYSTRLIVIALLWFVALGVNERIIFYVEPVTLGLSISSVLLMLLLFYTASTWHRTNYKYLLSLSLVPMLRILSLTLPLEGIPPVYWYLFLSVPTLVAVALTIQELDLSWRAIGFRLQGIPVQLLLALSGVLAGYVQYHFLETQPLIDTLAPRQVLFPALILMGAGFVEEVLFRGVIQHTMVLVLGDLGVLYTAALYALLNLGYQSSLAVLLIFGVSLIWGWLVARTGTFLGAALAHGVMNIMLFLIMPFLA